MSDGQPLTTVLTIGDLYTAGEINMEEAVLAMSEYIDEDDAVQLLTGLTRDNVIKFPEPRFEDVEPEKDEACSKAVFSFTAEFDLDDPA